MLKIIGTLPCIVTNTSPPPGGGAKNKNVAGRKKHLLARLGPLPRDAGKSKQSSGANSRGRFQGEGGDPSKRKAGNGSTHSNPMPKK